MTELDRVITLPAVFACCGSNFYYCFYLLPCAKRWAMWCVRVYAVRGRWGRVPRVTFPGKAENFNPAHVLIGQSAGDSTTQFAALADTVGPTRFRRGIWSRRSMEWRWMYAANGMRRLRNCMGIVTGSRESSDRLAFIFGGF